ncbi:hybrid sensor histidine kinase/response regulator [Massilia phyllosphaerae]|uniref:hybrid sensor histidine kinase/response regulator n=1 Tax=Massilia phyllosphaerae TaxID=3106034 RepID=UPI002B1CC5F2|nr:hybrid sensor histidine kinase/response regulator [Massilia sp. SGZ-792]
MGTYREQQGASEQRSIDETGRQSAGAQDAYLLHRIRVLEDELAAAREQARVQARERQAMEAGVALLREANEHLVLATFNAEHLREDAEAANRRQNEFLAMLAHELRNPLSPISMAASLLGTVPNATPQLANLARVIGRQVDHMARLLDDLLDAARISSGKITLSVQPLPLAELLQHAVETIQPRIQERRQQLQLTLAPGADAAVVDGDRVRLTQVFTNLIGNASKYTGDGGTLRVTASLDAGQALVVVEDDGIGMAPEVIPHIFDLFTQGPRSLARSEGGLGVGLNVVRNLLAMHGATVRADSAGLGQGSRFTVRLPRSSGTVGAQPPAKAAARPTALNILLIEDNVDACDMLAGFLASEGHQVRCAYDGHAGLAAALDGAWDVIICDVGLPGMDGLDLMRAVRAAEGGTHPFAVALSGYGQDDDRTRGLAAGFDRYLVKPVAAANLRDVIAELEGSEPGVAF